MSVALLIVAVLHEPLLELFRGLMRQRDPFAAAPRLCARTFAAGPSGDGDWRRYDTERGFVELGPFVRRTPTKITIVARFSTRAAAAAFVDQLAKAEPRIPHDLAPYRTTITVHRKLIGLELDVDKSEQQWRVAITLVAHGARTVVPNEPDHR